MHVQHGNNIRSKNTKWRKLTELEIENFLKRGSRKKVSREEAKIGRREIIPCKWVFKIKHELNKKDIN